MFRWTAPWRWTNRFIIQTALERHDHNVVATARALGATRETLRYRLQKYNLAPDAKRA